MLRKFADTLADNYAYINSTYADSMISIGVATLDAYDQYGYPYYTEGKKHTSADTLTSHPFKFTGSLPSPLYMSFFYQAGGKGDLPEGIVTNDPGFPGRDTLIVEIYSHDTVWVTVFKTLDNTTPHQFKQAIIQIPDTLVKDGFQFRFRNYVSLPDYPQGTDLGKFGNADQWHIDYIQLRQATNPQVMENLNDIMVVEPLLPSFVEYTAVPWHHFSLAQSAQSNERRTIPFSFRTYYPDSINTINSINRIYETYDLNSGDLLRARERHNPEPPFAYRHYEDSISSDFLYNENDTIGRFEIITYIETTAGESQRKVNDTLKRTETYYDHYAYDDGTAEFGFGIEGEQQEHARIALRFRTFRHSSNPDSLRAVLIYFCKSVDSVSANAQYEISIRKNDGAEPADDTLYTSDIFTPDYSAHLNEFTRIEINPPLLIADTFFVVIEQINGYLNIGYDINNNSRNNLYVYTNNEWTNPYSIPGGSLMIRPSFGNYSLPTQIADNEIQEDFILYPNPVTDRLNFSIVSDDQGQYAIRIFNLAGVMLYNTITRENAIAVDQLNRGIYFIEIMDLDTNKRYTSKFIKQ